FTGSPSTMGWRPCPSGTCSTSSSSRRRPSSPPPMASVTSVVSASAAERASAARAPRVDFLGLGVQKAATTWLFRMLAAHPDIFMARAQDKDLRFFSAYYDRGLVWYERHFAAAGPRRCGEFSTSYFYSKDAPERVFRYHPGIRLLLSLRDPVERLISHH